MKRITTVSIILSVLLITWSCKSSRVPETEIPEQISSNPNGSGQHLEVEFIRGEAHNHPLMAIWIEDEEGNYIQTLFVAESLWKGIFQHGDATSGKWLPAEIRRPAALPVWSHSRGIKEPDGLFVPTPEHAIADAYTGATPPISFKLNTRLDEQTNDKYYVLFEVNQTWDWNEYWTNNKYPDDDEYKTSCQPAVVYSTLIDLENPEDEYLMRIIGRSHESGANGELYDDLNTLTTALHSADGIVVRVVE